jgi:phosphatidylglycerol:prolipoprotein diacylglycerol transferase
VLNGWRRRVPIAFTAELVAPALALGYAIGRVGCFLVGDDYGVPTAVPWAVKFPLGLPPTTVASLTQFNVTFPPGTSPSEVVAVHPTQVYETTLMLLATAWLWKHRAHQHAAGWLFGCYLIMAGVERFAIEIFRAKDDRLLGDFTLAQVASVGLVVTGVFLVGKLRGLSAVSHQPSALARKGPESS